MKSPTQISKEIGKTPPAVLQRITPEFCTQYSQHIIIKHTAGGANRYLLDELAEQVIIKSFRRNDQGVLNDEERAFISKYHYLTNRYLFFKGLDENDYYGIFAECMVKTMLSLHTKRIGERTEPRDFKVIENPYAFFLDVLIMNMAYT